MMFCCTKWSDLNPPDWDKVKATKCMVTMIISMKYMKYGTPYNFEHGTYRECVPLSATLGYYSQYNPNIGNDNMDPFNYHGLTSIQSSNHMPSQMCDENTYQFPNFNGGTAQVWEWICNFIPRFTMYVITYQLWCWSLTMLLKGATGDHLLW